ncbi:MAG: tetraacyldisaccharide 4'-kinase [Nitrospirae bacterium]|nr:tetraacyldisaccharide 4'-kinase [Nitrospirota bacterium]
MGLLSGIYGLGLRCKRSFVKPGRLPAKVISVGNITLGGTGKTPAVIAIAEEAIKRGLMPCILTRGYKGKVKGPCFVQATEHRAQNTDIPPLTRGGIGGVVICTGIDAGDEPVLLADRLKDVPIVKCADRYKGGLFAIEHLFSESDRAEQPFAPANPSPVTRYPSLIFILDDGFQHWALHRDIDIVLVDAVNPFGNEKLFPEGRLREPLESLKRASIMVITKADMISRESLSNLVQKIKRYNQQAPVYTASHKPTAVVNASKEPIGLDVLKNKNVYAFAGIANPQYFKDTLISNGASIADFKSFRDHYIYKQRDIDKIISWAAGLDIITTEKDFVKLRDLQLPDNIFALRIEFTAEDDFYNYIFDLSFPLAGNPS